MTPKSITKEELAKLFTLNNVRGKVFSEKDITYEMLENFNGKLNVFARDNKDFDLFGEDYDGKSTDDFLQMLDDVSKLSDKVSLFEEMELDGTEELIGKTGDEAKKALVELKESYKPVSMRLRKKYETNFKNAIGKILENDSIGNKINRGIKLTESDINKLKDITKMVESESATSTVPGRGEASFGNDPSNQTDKSKGSGEKYEDLLENDSNFVDSLLRSIKQNAGWYCLDNKKDKDAFKNFVSSTYDKKYTDRALKIISKNDSWCTDNEGDMRAFLSVLFKKDFMGDYAEDYEPLNELIKMNESDNNNLDEVRKEAIEITTKEGGVIQHINKTKNGHYKLDDFYDSDNTVESYVNGERQ